MSDLPSGAGAQRDWPNPATVLERAERALMALHRAEEDVLALRELCRPASEDPADPGPVGSAAVLERIRKSQAKVRWWADIAARDVQHALSTTPAASRDGGSAPSI